jgi:hypothetical protein
MRKNLILAAVLVGGIIVLMPVTSSTPVFAQQTCAQSCEAQYPTASQDRNSRIAKNKCVAACNKKK